MRAAASMRALALTGLVALALGGCSLLFDGKDLKGKNGGGGDLGLGDEDMAGGGGGDDLAGSGGGDMTGGGACTPVTHAITFAVAPAPVGATGPYALATGDVDGDGNVDVVTANYNSNSFSVLLGKGDGTFTLAPSTPLASCSSPQQVLVDDFTGDGKPDVLVACWYNSSAPQTAAIKLHPNTSTAGSVSFATALAVTPPAVHVFYVASGRFGGDSHRDLAFVDYEANQVVFMLGTGIAFTPQTPVATGMSPDYPSVGDVNQDGVDDLLVANYNDNTLSLVTSTGTTPAWSSQRLAYDMTGMSGTAYFIYDPRLVDLDGDGDLDIVMASATTTPGNVEVLVNSGSATAWVFPDTATDYPTGDAPLTLTTGDFNCDGKTDVVTASKMVSKIWVLPRLGNGFDAPQPTTLSGAYSIAAADFNKDGYPDVAVGGAGTAVQILLNNH